MRKFNLDGIVFQDEYGTLSANAFEILNHTLSIKYGRCKLFRDAVDLVSKNFDIVADNKSKNHYQYNRKYVIEHFSKLTKIYYDILEIRKKRDYEFKLNKINNDFQQFVNIILHNFTINPLTTSVDFSIFYL